MLSADTEKGDSNGTAPSFSTAPADADNSDDVDAAERFLIGAPPREGGRVVMGSAFLISMLGETADSVILAFKAEGIAEEGARSIALIDAEMEETLVEEALA